MSILNFYYALITQVTNFVLAHIFRSRDRNINDETSKPWDKNMKNVSFEWFSSCFLRLFRHDR